MDWVQKLSFFPNWLAANDIAAHDKPNRFFVICLVFSNAVFIKNDANEEISSSMEYFVASFLISVNASGTNLSLCKSFNEFSKTRLIAVAHS